MVGSDKIKILHLVSDLGIGGVQKVVLDICSTADLDKYEVSVFLLKDDKELLSTYSLSPKIIIRAFDYRYSADYSLMGYMAHTLTKKIVARRGVRIIEEAIKLSPDIIHLHIHPRELNLGILIAQQTKSKLIYTEHLVRFTPASFSLNLLAKILRPIYRKYNLIAVSKSVLKEINEHRLCGKNKLLVLIENKLNLTLLPPVQIKMANSITFVYVARIGHPKGHELLVKAWNNLPPSLNKKLLLVGPDELNNEIHELAKKLALDKSIVFLGKQLNVANILSKADIGVFPSYKEGLPISLLEKMAMELPVIVSNIPELTDVIQHNVNGLTFRSGDVNDLTEKMLQLIDNPELRLQLGKAARRTVEERFGTTNIAFANEIIYEKVMKSS
ncbi:MAG: glycosyltransferase [Bacteroidetes bacterium]|nr:glycosyltransferase [Bacteroidota bacterium]